MQNRKGKVNIGVIGLGWWGPNLVRNFRNHPNVARVIGCERNRSLAKESRKTLGINVVANVNDLLMNPEINGVAIATPTPTHYSLAKQSLQNDKHVFLEKPPVRKLIELEKLHRIACQHQKVLMADFTFMYHPAVRRLRELIYSKRNALKYIQIYRWNNDLHRQPLSRILATKTKRKETVISDLMYHDLAVLIFLLGNRIRFQGKVMIDSLWSRSQDTAWVNLKWGKIPIHVSLSWTTPERKKEIIVYFEKEYIKFDDLNSENPLTQFHYNTKKKKYYRLVNTMPLACATNHFVSCLRNQTLPESGYEMMKSVLGLYQNIMRQ